MSLKEEYKEYSITAFDDCFYVKHDDHRDVIVDVQDYEESFDTEEEVMKFAKKVIDEEKFRCSHCGDQTDFEDLETGKVGSHRKFCSDCAKACKDCGEEDWEGLGKKTRSARYGYRYKCRNCGNMVETMPTG